MAQREQFLQVVLIHRCRSVVLDEQREVFPKLLLNKSIVDWLRTSLRNGSGTSEITRNRIRSDSVSMIFRFFGFRAMLPERIGASSFFSLDFPDFLTDFWVFVSVSVESISVSMDSMYRSNLGIRSATYL